MAKIGFWQGAKTVQQDRSNDQCGRGAEPSRTVSRAPSAIDETRSSEALLLLRAYEDSNQGWFWATDTEGRLSYLTEQIVPLLCGSRSELQGLQFADLFMKGDEGFGVGRNLSFMLSKQSKFEKIIVRAAAGSVDAPLWSVSGTPQFDVHGHFTGFRGSGVDITEQRKSSDHASRLAMYDTLTGLPNRRRMAEILEGDLLTLDTHKRSCAVLMLDLDRFKQVNDTLGHPAGDELLRQVAERIQQNVDDSERVFRLGGDEFQVILRDCEDRDHLRELGDRIISILSQPYTVSGSRCIIGASIGIAIGPTDGRGSEDLIRNADLALYAAKASGRGCVAFFSNDMLKEAEDRRRLEEDLRDALSNGEIHVFYQPIVNARTNLTTGVEALVRWHHPERGSISPALFIPIAEESNLIGPLGEWILRQACHDAATWPGNLRLAVNVSPIQFTSGALPGIVTSALASSGLSPDRLELEITEGVFLSDSAAADIVFSALKQIGVRLALDDFGTGYSSLGYLRTAPFDKIKIDQSFVRAATLPGSRNSALIAAIVALAEALGMETTAEGIESHDQLDLIQSLGVSHVQGFIYSQAISSDELKERVESGGWIIAPSGPSRQRSDRLSMYRRVRGIFGNHYRSVLIRNISETGALVEGLDDIPFGSELIIDFGEGHLVVAKITRSRNRQQGVIFEVPLVNDGHGGLRTAQQVSPYTLQSSGLPRLGDSENLPVPEADNSVVLELLRSRLGLERLRNNNSLIKEGDHPACPPTARTPEQGARSDQAPTIAALSKVYLEQLGEDTKKQADAERFLEGHILPSFGHMRVDELTPSLVGPWLKSKSDDDSLAASTIEGLQSVLGELYLAAICWGGPSPPRAGLTEHATGKSRDVHERPLTAEEIGRLQVAARASANPQLKFIIALLILTRVRQRDLLEACWDQFDLDTRVWTIPSAKTGNERTVHLSQKAIDVLAQLPRWENCPYLVANPATLKPYRSFLSSWQTARIKADLADVEIDDLRFCGPEESMPSADRPEALKKIINGFVRK